MNHLINKFSLVVITSTLYITSNAYLYNILFILCAISLSSCLSIATKYEKRYLIYIMYFVLCILNYDFIFFIPLLLYDLFNNKESPLGLTFIIFIIIYFDHLGITSLLLLLNITLLSYILKIRTNQYELLKEKNKRIKDESEELKILQELKHIELLEKQDYEIQVAKLEERNRIAREIHDSVGHNLSSSLLQIGAIIAINQDTNLTDPLNNIKGTLSNGMTSIRQSVHNLHEDNLKLEEEMQSIIQQFNYCKINFIFKSSNLMDIKLKYCFLNILKEALNNIMKHSNASQVNISLIETPIFYQFIIKDNGTKIKMKDGLGLKSMQERTHSFKGIFNYSIDDGFKVFINIPKEQTK